jgi:DNA-binding LacI/PurR family transcriptional regulator
MERTISYLFSPAQYGSIGRHEPGTGKRMSREAGMSHVTVSHVLNNHKPVRPETRARVEAAIEKLGYRPDSVARALNTRRSSTIGVILAGEELNELPRIPPGVQSAAQRAGYWVNLASWQGGTTRDLTETLRRLADQAIEAIAVIADRSVVVDALADIVTGVPVTVIMSGNVPNPELGFVEFDQELGARPAVEHLLGLGHRRIVHLAGPVSTFDFWGVGRPRGRPRCPRDQGARDRSRSHAGQHRQDP